MSEKEHYYFVDEAGDGTLYDKHGKCLVGTEGCSRFFMLGAIVVSEPERLVHEMEALRESLLADPYFAGVPSMQVAQRKTALAFHAKDDVPEVRREVFSLLRRHDIRFYAAVRNKALIEKSVQYRNKTEAGYRYHPNELYDWTVTRLFTPLIQQVGNHHIIFASRGSSDRTNALTLALNRIPGKPVDAASDEVSSSFTIKAIASRERTELQAADYFLWTLQRFFENGEERFLSLMWPQYESVCYMHPNPSEPLYYIQKEPLNKAALATLTHEGLPKV